MVVLSARVLYLTLVVEFFLNKNKLSWLLKRIAAMLTLMGDLVGKFEYFSMEFTQFSLRRVNSAKSGLIQLILAQFSQIWYQFELILFNFTKFGSNHLNQAQFNQIWVKSSKYSLIQLNLAQFSSIRLYSAQYNWIQNFSLQLNKTFRENRN